MCKGSGCNLDRNFETLSPALRPEAPGHPDDEAFESTDGLSFGLALSDASIEIRASLRWSAAPGLGRFGKGSR